MTAFYVKPISLLVDSASAIVWSIIIDRLTQSEEIS